MAGSVRRIRKVQISKVADFDEQLWPINCAILILAGFVVGIIIATSDFSGDFGTERILYNGWVRLFSVAVMVGLLFWGVVLLQGKMLRRLQLCILISLLAHLWLAMYLHEQYLALLAQREADSVRQIAEPSPQITVPDYHFEQLEEPEKQQSFEEPIRAELPDPTQPEAVKREASEPEVPTDLEPPQEPEIPQRQQPNPAIIRRAELSAPRRADAAAGGQISRQEWKHLPRPNEPIPEERVQLASGKAATVPDANLAPRRQQPTEVRIEQRRLFEDLSSRRAEPVRVRLARRATRPQPIADLPTTPTPTRQVRQPAEIARTEAAVPEQVATAGRPRAVQPQPAERIFARRRAKAAALVRPTSEPTATPTAPIPHFPVRPAPSAVVRSRTGRAPGASRSLPAAAKGGQAAHATQRPTQPSHQLSANRPPRTARSQQAPQIAVARIEPAAVSSPAAASTRPSLPTVRPMTTSVSTAAAWSNRVPHDQPAGRALPAMTRSAQLPAAVARRRASASQREPAGGEAVAARPSSLARSKLGANIPSTAIATEAQRAAIPAATGGTPASRLSLASAAAVRRKAADPAPGSSVAAAGTADFAIGSTQIVARSGQPRALGIGQPSVTANASTPRIARAKGPAPSIAASGVAEAAPAASGAVASNARGPATPSLNIRGSTVRRGGRVSELAEEAAIGSGPAGSSGTPGPVEVATNRHVTRYPSIDSAIAGSGTPKPGRTAGGAALPDATAAVSKVASGAPRGETASQAPPLQAQVSGPRRQVPGSPGGLESQPAAGALASLAREGAPLANAVARRAAAAGRAAGGLDISAPESVTMKRKDRGTDLPAAAVPVEDLAETGVGGVTVAQGGLPSLLPKDSSATVRHAAADLDVAQTTAASGPSESGIGAALTVALAGRARAAAEGFPAPATDAATPRIRRSPASRPAITAPGPLEAQPAAESVAAAPAAESGGTQQPIGGVPAAALARRAGRLAANQPAAEVGLPAPLAGGTLVAVPSRRASRDESAMAIAAPVAVAGPKPRSGALRASGTAAAPAELAEAGPSSGGIDAAADSPVKADLAGPQRQMVGLPGGLTDRIAVEAATRSGPMATTPGTTRGRRRLPQGMDSGPALAAEVGRGPRRKTDVAGLPRGVAEAIEEQPIAAAAAELGDAMPPADRAGIGEPTRREGGLPVQIAAVAGPGGLGYDPSLEVGLPSRRARPESEIVHTVSRRFVMKRSGGQLAIDGRVREQPTEAFRQRDVGRRAQVAQAGGGSEGTERAVEMGLDYFARHQFPDGHWSLHELPPGIEYDDPALGEMRADTAATGLALLGYLGAGYTHLDEKHRAVVSRGIDWLLRHQKPNGDLFTSGTRYAWFYSHGIATIALCEAYGMTRDPELREPARRAIDFICKTQHPTRGGWRYFLSDRGVSTEADTSVSGWMLMALKSAQMAGLEVPDETFQKVDAWLDTARARRAAGQYVYNPHAKNIPEQRHGRRPNLAMTAEAMLMRMYLGRGRDDSGLIAGAEHLKNNLPAVGTKRISLRDCYYWYYATQAMFQMHGDYWTAWNDRLRPLAESSQVQTGEAAGSWHPKRPTRDAWGDEGGRHYVTALHLLMLEVYYRHLPLFQELSK